MIQEEGGEGGSEVVSSRGEVWYWRLREEEQEEDLSDALSHTRRSLSLSCAGSGCWVKAGIRFDTSPWHDMNTMIGQRRRVSAL